MARPLQSGGGKEVAGSKGVIKKVEFVRIIAKALYSLGYIKTGALLEEESGIPLHSSVVNVFMRQILEGNWDESIVTLHNIGLTDEKTIKSVSFLILEQKFLDLLDEEKVMDALKTLRTEITPLGANSSRVRELSSYFVSPSYCSSVRSPKQDTLRARSRSKLLEELQKLLPPTVMIPEGRLEHLVEQALVLQRDACMFHNSLDKEMSLYADHQCGRDQIPSQALQILQAHSDEVWFLKFSHNGRYLASSSNDQSAIIWEVYLWHRGTGELIETLPGHSGAVNCVSWNPANPHMLASASDDRTIRIWGLNNLSTSMKQKEPHSNGIHYSNGGT